MLRISTIVLKLVTLHTMAFGMSEEEYVQKLFKDTAQIIKSGQMCKQVNYDRLYSNVSILSMFNNDLAGRTDIIETVRIKCHGQKFTMELMEPKLGDYNGGKN